MMEFNLQVISCILRNFSMFYGIVFKKISSGQKNKSKKTKGNRPFINYRQIAKITAVPVKKLLSIPQIIFLYKEFIQITQMGKT